jgi:hypothetical protein
VTTTTSLIPAVTDYLVTAATASTALGAAVPQVIVLDGPPVTGDTLVDPRHLFIGWDPQAANTPAAQAVQDFAFIDHARTRDEDGEIMCAADAWGGSTVMKVHRDSAAAIVAAVELMLRGDPASGGPGDASMGGLVFWAGVAGPYAWYPRQTPDGAGMLCTFRITYRARLTT